MQKYFLLGTTLTSLALLGVFGFGPQSKTFGKTLREADAAKIWGGDDCTSGWGEIANGACTTWSPSACLWDPYRGCVNECEINCVNVNTWTAGGGMDGMLAELACTPFMLPTCDGSDGDCACVSPTTPYPCEVPPMKFFFCFQTGP
jgi:hypothetical protein